MKLLTIELCHVFILARYCIILYHNTILNDIRREVGLLQEQVVVVVVVVIH